MSKMTTIAITEEAYEQIKDHSIGRLKEAKRIRGKRIVEVDQEVLERLQDFMQEHRLPGYSEAIVLLSLKRAAEKYQEQVSQD